MIGRDAILSLVPHAGAMCLWDEVVAWDATRIELRAANHHDPAHPLRSAGRLRALHLCEYGAQAMAVHGGLRARERGGVAAPGLLVALRGVVLHVDRVDDLLGPLEGSAEQLAESPAHGRLQVQGAIQVGRPQQPSRKQVVAKAHGGARGFCGRWHAQKLTGQGFARVSTRWINDSFKPVDTGAKDSLTSAA